MINDVVSNERETEPLEWPERADDPVSEFSEECLLTKAFPTLFPTPAGDPTSRSYGVKKAPRTAEALAYLMHFADGRFARHPRFRYFVLNKWQREQTLQSSSVFVRNDQSVNALTCEELSQLADGPAEALGRKLERYVSYLRGSVGWKRQRRSELQALIDAVGRLPTFFVTFSAADLQWKKLQELLEEMSSGNVVDSVNDAGRATRVINDPGTCALYFEQVMRIRYSQFY